MRVPAGSSSVTAGAGPALAIEGAGPALAIEGAGPALAIEGETDDIRCTNSSTSTATPATIRMPMPITAVINHRTQSPPAV